MLGGGGGGLRARWAGLAADAADVTAVLDAIALAVGTEDGKLVPEKATGVAGPFGTAGARGAGGGGSCGGRRVQALSGRERSRFALPESRAKEQESLGYAHQLLRRVLHLEHNSGAASGGGGGGGGRDERAPDGDGLQLHGPPVDRAHRHHVLQKGSGGAATRVNRRTGRHATRPQTMQQTTRVASREATAPC